MCVRIVTAVLVLEKSALVFAVAILMVNLSSSHDNGFFSRFHPPPLLPGRLAFPPASVCTSAIT